MKGAHKTPPKSATNKSNKSTGAGLKGTGQTRAQKDSASVASGKGGASRRRSGKDGSSQGQQSQPGDALDKREGYGMTYYDYRDQLVTEAKEQTATDRKAAFKAGTTAERWPYSKRRAYGRVLEDIGA